MTWPPMQRDDKSVGFFAGAEIDRLMIRTCDSCGWKLPPEAAVCTRCANVDLSWIRAAGTGRLVSWTVVHRAPNPAFADLVPYTVGVIALSEGPLMYGRIITEPRLGKPVVAVFEHGDEGESYPVWRGVV